MLNSVSVIIWAVEMVANSMSIMNAWLILFVVFPIIMAVCFVVFDRLLDQSYDFFWLFGYFVVWFFLLVLTTICK